MDAREYLQMLGHRRWESMTAEQQQQHIRRMIAGQRKAKKHKRAKAAKVVSTTPSKDSAK